MQNFGFTTVLSQFDVFSCGVLPSRAESVHLLKPHLQWGKGWKSSNFVTPDDSARNRRCARWCHWTLRFVWCPFLGLERYTEFGIPKAVLPSSARGFLPPYHVEMIQCYHLLHELAHELAPVFCRAVFCFALVGRRSISKGNMATSLNPGRSTRSIACCRDEWIS